MLELLTYWVWGVMSVTIVLMGYLTYKIYSPDGFR